MERERDSDDVWQRGIGIGMVHRAQVGRVRQPCGVQRSDRRRADAFQFQAVARETSTGSHWAPVRAFDWTVEWKRKSAGLAG